MKTRLDILRSAVAICTIVVSAALTTAASPSAEEQLAAAVEAHGGLATWRGMAAVEYDQVWHLGPAPLRDHQLIELRNRRVLITADAYKIGFDGEVVWITPNRAALKMPARFYHSTPFYFFGMPFVFADPGINLESQGTKTVGDKEYNVVRVSYAPGVGDTPEDDYVAYFDANTRRLHLVHYIVTYPPFRQGKPVSQLERHALVFDEWQTADGLVVPKRARFFEWADGAIKGEMQGWLEFHNVQFRQEPPEPEVFARPEGAEVDDSHKQADTQPSKRD